MLGSLLAPVAVPDFVATCLGRRPLRHDVDPDTFRSLASLPALQSARALVASAKGPCYSWRPENWLPRRSPARGDQALGEYDAGCSLYFTKVEQGVPALAEACRAIERELGIPGQCVSVQAFASRAGYGVDLHFDHDENFNLQVTGRKVWRMGTNHFVRNPLKGGFWGPSFFREQGLPADAEPPLPRLDSFETAPGALVYVPRGFWHGTRCLDDSIAIAFAVQPPYAFQMVLAAVQRRLVEDPCARAFAIGVTRPGLPANQEFMEALAPMLRQLSDVEAADCVSLETGSPPAAHISAGARFRATAPGRGSSGGLRPPLQVSSRWAALVEGLLATEGFVVDDRLARDHGCSAAELERIVEELVHNRMVERVG